MASYTRESNRVGGVGGTIIDADDINYIYTGLEHISANVMAPLYGALGDGSNDDSTAINAAITAVNTAGGGVVLIPEGTFIVQNITLKSNVILRGVGKGSILKLKNSTTADVIKSAGTSSVTQITFAGVENLVVDGNKANQSSGVTLQQYGIALQFASDCWVDHCWIKDTQRSGIYFSGSRNRATYNHLSGIGKVGAASSIIGRSGIIFDVGASTDPVKSVAAFNDVVDCLEHGIKVYAGGDGSIIHANHIGVAGDFGIWTETANDPSVTSNVVDGSVEVGIYVKDGDNGTVTGNTVLRTTVDPVDFGGHGIMLSGMTDTTVVGNTCNENGSVGVRVYNSTGCTIGPNTTCDNTDLGVQETGTSDYNIFTHGAIKGNGADTFTISGANSSVTGLGHVTWSQDFYYNDVPGTDTQPYKLAYFDSASTALISATNLFKAPVNLHIIGMIVQSDDDWTAGTADTYIKINGASGVNLAGTLCRLSTSDREIKYVFAASHAAGLAVTAGQTIQPELDTASWTPTTANFRCKLIMSND